MGSWHLTATILGRRPLLTEPASARWTMERLRVRFPDALASALMPDHLHLLVPEPDPRALQRSLGQHGSVFGVRWGPVHVEHASTLRIERRTIRYILSNPVRAGFVVDPLQWPWSTARDLVDATVGAWTVAAVGRRFVRSRDSWHTLLTELLDGAALPPSVAARGVLTATTGDAEAAVTAACRQFPEALRRRGPTRDLFVATVDSLGLGRRVDTARICGIQRHAVAGAVDRTSEHALRAARRCLADARLRATFPETVER